MNQLQNAFNRLMIPCPKCNGSGQSGVFKKHPCSKCGGTGQIKTRPFWVGPMVVFGFIFCLAILMGIAFLTAKPAAAESPEGVAPASFDILVEKNSSEVSEESIAEPAPCHVSDKYPEEILRWCELITKYAHENNIPSNMIAAVMLQESGGNPSIRSHCGAVGLMQIMPNDTTWEEQSRCDFDGSLFQNRPSSADLTDPEFNINHSARMLAELYQESDDWREALKAYGPKNYGYGYADLVLQHFENYK